MNGLVASRTATPATVFGLQRAAASGSSFLDRGGATSLGRRGASGRERAADVLREVTVRARSPARGRLRAALGDRDLLRRAQDPPARPAHRPALTVPGAGHPGDLGPPVLPLRDTRPDEGRRRPCRPRPGPCLVRRGTAHLSAIHRPAGRFSPLTATTPSAVSGATPSANSSAGSYPRGNLAPTPESSNANTPNGTSNDPITTTGPNPTGYRNRPW